MFPWLAGACVAVLIGLATWQGLRMMEWEERHLARTARVAMAPIPLAAAMRSLEEHLFRAVWAEGVFAFEHALRVGIRGIGGKVESQLVVPFRISPSGEWLLVVMGWQDGIAAGNGAEDRMGPEWKKALGPSRFEGWLVPARPARGMAALFVPRAEVDLRWWPRLDSAAIGAELGLQGIVLPLAARLRRPETADAEGNPHRGYMITWLMLAIGAAAVAVLRMRARAG